MKTSTLAVLLAGALAPAAVYADGPQPAQYSNHSGVMTFRNTSAGAAVGHGLASVASFTATTGSVSPGGRSTVTTATRQSPSPSDHGKSVCIITVTQRGAVPESHVGGVEGERDVDAQPAPVTVRRAAPARNSAARLPD